MESNICISCGKQTMSVIDVICSACCNSFNLGTVEELLENGTIDSYDLYDMGYKIE